MDDPVEYSKNRSAKRGKKLFTSALGRAVENLAQNASAKPTMRCLRTSGGRPVLLTRALRAAWRMLFKADMTSGLSNVLAQIGPSAAKLQKVPCASG
jgi:hypothetical protein